MRKTWIILLLSIICCSVGGVLARILTAQFSQALNAVRGQPPQNGFYIQMVFLSSPNPGTTILSYTALALLLVGIILYVVFIVRIIKRARKMDRH